MSDAATFDLPKSVLSILEPPPKLSVSEWCDEFRILDGKFSARPGRWATRLVPHLREPLDAAVDPSISVLVAVACAQGAKTEFGNNVLGYLADCRPTPCLYVRPSEPEIQEVFGDDGRFRRLFESCERLRRHIPTGHFATRDTIHLDSMNIYGAWTTSPNTLTSRPIGFIYFDEVDNCEKAGGRLGNHWNLAKERGLTWGYRFTMVGTGTPDKKHDTLWTEYHASDAREYWEPCPHCGVFQPLAFDRIQVPKGERDVDKIVMDLLAWYRCRACEREIDQTWQGWMADRGRWVPGGVEIVEPLPMKGRGSKRIREVGALELSRGDDRWEPEREGKAKRTNQRGYRWWRANLKWDTSSWSHIIAEHFKAGHDPQKRKVFQNAWLAEPWEEAVETADIDVIRAKVSAGMPPRVVHERAKILLCEADVQPDYLFYSIHAWGGDEESWMIQEGRCFSLDELYDIAFRTGYAREDTGEAMNCMGLVIDSRHRREEVLRFGKRPGVKLVQGVDGARMPGRWRPTKVEYRARGGVKKMSQRVYSVNTSLYIEKAHAMAMAPTGRAGAWHLHRETTDEYCQHITNMQQVPRRKQGRGTGGTEWIWEPKTEHARVDWLHCRVYGLALADMLNVPLLGKESSPMMGMTEVAAARAVPKQGGGKPQGAGAGDPRAALRRSMGGRRGGFRRR